MDTIKTKPADSTGYKKDFITNNYSDGGNQLLTIFNDMYTSDVPINFKDRRDSIFYSFFHDTGVRSISAQQDSGDFINRILDIYDYGNTLDYLKYNMNTTETCETNHNSLDKTGKVMGISINGIDKYTSISDYIIKSATPTVENRLLDRCLDDTSGGRYQAQLDEIRKLENERNSATTERKTEISTTLRELNTKLDEFQTSITTTIEYTAIDSNPPEYLIVFINRTNVDSEGNSIKNNKVFISDHIINFVGRNYKIVGSIIHSGKAGGGHYEFVRIVVDGSGTLQKYIVYNDEEVIDNATESQEFVGTRNTGQILTLYRLIPS